MSGNALASPEIVFMCFSTLMTLAACFAVSHRQQMLEHCAVTLSPVSHFLNSDKVICPCAVKQAEQIPFLHWFPVADDPQMTWKEALGLSPSQAMQL